MVAPDPDLVGMTRVLDQPRKLSEIIGQNILPNRELSEFANISRCRIIIFVTLAEMRSVDLGRELICWLDLIMMQ